jgi:GTPase SAR1 family protein
MGDRPQQINKAFRKQDSIGVNDAADDKQFLFECFVDTGDYDVVRDFKNARCLILGRTGVGKTALLTKLQEDNKDKENVIVINPEALAMHHISNSTIIRYMYELGIDMNTFFKLLWRHAICVEIFNQHFKIATYEETETFIDRLRYRFKKTNVHHLRALNYLEEWRHTFWKKSDDHVTDMISKKETELSGTLGASASSLSAKLMSKEKLSEEQTRIIKQRAQSIVDEVQMREVTDLLAMLNEVIEDQQRQYYVIVDKLDEGWVDDELRYRLIKALIETVRDLNRFDNLKPLVVLRADLLGHVFELTKDSGFQEEKYSSLYLHVRWTRRQLVELVDRRVNFLLKSRYTRKELDHSDILPDKISNQITIDYILDRTLMRPRDVIEFFNIIIREAAENPVVTEQMVLEPIQDLSSRFETDFQLSRWRFSFG